MYFCDDDIEVFKRDEIMKKASMALLMKRSSENLPNAIDDVVAQMIYGNCRKAPGDENSPYRKLLQAKEEAEIPGVWAPPNSLAKAVTLKWFFPNLSGPFKLPDDKPIPPHLIVGYDAFKHKEIMELSKLYPEAVMKYGFFSTDIPGKAELITKTVEKFERRLTPPTYDEKIVIQLMKSEEWMEEFRDLGPSYISPDTVQGAEDAKLFFPSSYDIPEDIIMEIKKKSKKKAKGKFVAVVEAHEERILQSDKGIPNENGEPNEQNVEGHDLDEEKTNEGEGEGDGEGEEDEAGEEEEEGEKEITEIDKATSPMNDDKDDNT